MKTNEEIIKKVLKDMEKESRGYEVLDMAYPEVHKALQKALSEAQKEFKQKVEKFREHLTKMKANRTFNLIIFDKIFKEEQKEK